MERQKKSKKLADLRTLGSRARARAQGRPRLVLYTNVMMWENVALYGRWGFAETGRRREDGYERVYFAKDLAAEA